MYSKKQKLDSTDKISKEIVSIPVHQNLTESDTDRIIKTINEIC
jgi:dTDP-4-amino-4,6-dideoxygalactose transaminase